MPTVRPFLPFILAQAKGVADAVDFGSDTLKATLHTASYVPDLDAHEFFDDVTDELPAAGGYTPGGVVLTGVDVIAFPVTDLIALVADPVEWNPLSATFRYVVVRADSGTPATSRLIVLVTYEVDQVPTVSQQVEWAAPDQGGLLKWQSQVP